MMLTAFSCPMALRDFNRPIRLAGFRACMFAADCRGQLDAFKAAFAQVRQRDEIERTAHAMLGENRDYQLLRMSPRIDPISIALAALCPRNIEGQTARRDAPHQRHD